MKRATRGHKPEWFDRPSNVVGVNVCRMSGKLPNGGCDSVQVVSREGMVEKRSMIYTEYFVRGTQPTTACPLHENPSFIDTLAGIFGKDVGKPASADEAGLPLPPAASTSGTRPASAEVARRDPAPKEEKVEEPKKKRGFWSRLFGVGGDKKDDEKKKEEEKKKLQQKKPSGG
jgi:hypothetical protein